MLYRHGLALTPEYKIWWHMKDRCLNPQAKDYVNYGKRGIAIDPTWMDFLTFYQDMGSRPSPKHTLERVNSYGPYNKANCIWATRTRQNRNRPRFAKLTKQDAIEIRRLYATGNWTQRELAEQYSIWRNHVFQIIHSMTWR